MIWFDRIIVAGILFLLIFTPLAIGAVHPWSVAVAEITIFVLIIVWMAKLALMPGPRKFAHAAFLWVPALCFVAFMLVQILPMPPGLQRLVSPSTYNLYATSLPGWPRQAPYDDADSPWSDISDASQRGGLSARQAQGATASSTWRSVKWHWRSISIAPRLTEGVLLQFMAYGCLFFLALFYPFGQPSSGRDGAKRFCRLMLKAVICIGLLVGGLALLEQAFWNGRILWFFVPYDWGGPRPDMADRAIGPFVNPDHFAGYLNMVMPLALSGALFRNFLSRRSSPEPFRVLCAATAFVLILAIELTLSRAGWIAGLLGFSMIIWLALPMPSRAANALSRRWRPAAIAFYGIAMVGMVAGTAIYIGSSGRGTVNARIVETVGQPDLGYRVGIWRDSLKLIRDFPSLGVGLGCFQDLFARYRKPPWSPASIRQAHNDYLELIADGGLIGFGLFLWFALAAVAGLYRRLKVLPPETLPATVALVAGLAAMAVQEVFDFNLQIPANAILLTVLLAIALRVSGAVSMSSSEYSPRRVRCFAGAVALGAAALIIAALGPDERPYPYLSAKPMTARRARALIFSHPARSMPHVWYAALNPNLSGAARVRELRIALLLEPANPLVRDLYADALVREELPASGLSEVTRSVLAAPGLANHFYLRPDLIPLLSSQERAAVETGLKTAAERGVDGSLAALAGFYDATHSYLAEAELLAAAAAKEADPAIGAQRALDAGVAYVKAGALDKAEAAFGAAATLQPSDPQAYEYLATQIFARRKDTAAAQAAVRQGIQNGADARGLYLSLAQASEAAGDPDGAESALLNAVKVAPDDADFILQLAAFYLRVNKTGKAVVTMRKVTEIRPQSAAAFYQLGSAEEADYQYFAAERDFAHALSLAPDNAVFKSRYRDLQHKIATDSGRHNRSGTVVQN